MKASSSAHNRRKRLLDEYAWCYQSHSCAWQVNVIVNDVLKFGRHLDIKGDAITFLHCNISNEATHSFQPSTGIPPVCKPTRELLLQCILFPTDNKRHLTFSHENRHMLKACCRWKYYRSASCYRCFSKKFRAYFPLLHGSKGDNFIGGCCRDCWNDDGRTNFFPYWLANST